MKTNRVLYCIGLYLLLGIIVFNVNTGLASKRTIVRQAKDFSHASGRIGNYKALIIGIDTYQDKEIEDLQTAVNDAKALADVLENRYGFQTRE